MRLIINDLVSFVKEGSDSSVFSEYQDSLDFVRLRLVCIKLLGWLKTRSKYHTEKPLRLSSYPWCSDLEIFLKLSSELREVFYIDGEYFDFTSEVDFDERLAIAHFVDENYQPKLIT